MESTLIKLDIYLVKKKRDDVDDGTGCTSCRDTCSENCVCRYFQIIFHLSATYVPAVLAFWLVMLWANSFTWSNRVQCISCSKACRCSENCTNRPFRKDKKIKIVKVKIILWKCITFFTSNFIVVIEFCSFSLWFMLTVLLLLVFAN